MKNNSAFNDEIKKKLAANKNEELYRALAELSSLQIEIIQMRFWEELTIDQIASVVCLTWDEADNLINETIAILRSKIEQQISLTPMPQAA